MPVIDVHAHLEPRMLAVDAMRAKLRRDGIDKVVLIPAMNDPLPHTPEALLGVFRRLMRSRLHRLARRINDRFYTADGDLELRGKIIRIYASPDNQGVADAVAAHPDLFLGWIFLNPRAGDPVDELERWRGLPGMVGVKLHPHWHRYPVADALPIARRCEELGLPVLIHLGFADGGDWKLIADACPRLKMVFAHAGIPHYDRMWGLIRDRPGLHIDVSSPYLSERLVRDAGAAVGPGRVMYGTDAPYGFPEPDHSYDYGAIKGWVERLPLAAGEVDRVLGGNVLDMLDRR